MAAIASYKLKFLTQNEVARTLGCSVEKVKQLRREKKLAFYNFGHRSVRVRQSDLERFIRGRQQ